MSAHRSSKVGAVDSVVLEHPERSRWQMLVKRVVQVIFLVWVTPRLLIYGVSAFVWGRDRAFLSASESIARIPGMRGVYARQAFYHRTLAACGKDVYFGWGSVFAMPAARVGERAYIGRRCGIGFADIGSEAMLADGVQVLSGGREHIVATQGQGAHQGQPQVYRQITIERGAWIGTNAVIMANIGQGTVVGAGSVVNKPIPERSVAVGVPAKVVRRLE